MRKSANRRHKKAIGECHGVDFSLLQSKAEWKDTRMRLDPGAFRASAGGLTKRDGPCHFFETEEQFRPAVSRLAPERTDPITHFRHEGEDVTEFMNERWAKKRNDYTCMAAKATLIINHDARLSAALKRSDIKPQIVVGADAVRHYNFWGEEDLRMAATKDMLKCERKPRDAHIVSNNKELLPYFWREGPSEKRPVHAYGKSQGIWDALRDEAYGHEMGSRHVPADDDPGQQRKYYLTKLERKKEMYGELSDDELRDVREASRLEMMRPWGPNGETRHRKLNTSRSLPPERPERRHFPVQKEDGFVQMARSARLKTAPVSETSSCSLRNTNQTPQSQQVRPASATCGSRTPGETSGSMSPVTITSTWVAARRNSAQKNARPRTPPP